MKRIFLLTSILLLAGCATPTMTMKNERTGQVSTCGGGVAGSVAGGMIGYSIQRNNDQKCIDALKSQGFKIEDVK